MHSHHIRTSRLNIHYLEAGHGEPLLLVHGWPQSSHCWHKVLPQLAQHFRVIAPDLRGFGLSEKSGLPLSRAQLADDLLSLLDALQIGRAHVAGHDWGGMVAFKLALEHPQRVGRLALLDCSTTHWPHWAAHGLWAKVPGWAEDYFARCHAAFIRWCFAGERAEYPGDVITPFPAAAMPGLDWCDAPSLQHYLDNLAQAGTQAASVSLYRDALPFYRQTVDGSWQAMTADDCRAIWLHEGGPFRHPDYRSAICFAPEDLGRRIGNPTLLVYTPMLQPRGFRNSQPVPDYRPAGDPYSDSLAAPFADLHCAGIACGHFIPEEQPDALLAHLLPFLLSA